jgi:hypothetical protein
VILDRFDISFFQARRENLSFSSDFAPHVAALMERYERERAERT